MSYISSWSIQLWEDKTHELVLASIVTHTTEVGEGWGGWEGMRRRIRRLTIYFEVLFSWLGYMGLIYLHIRSRRTWVQLHAFSFIFHPESTFLAAPDYISVLFGYICMLFSSHISVLFGYICMRFTSPPRLHHPPYWTFHPYSHTSS